MDFEKLRQQLQDRIENKKTAGEGEFMEKYWVLEDGETILRLLPSKDPEDDRPFYAETKLHRVPQPDGNTGNYHCMYFHTKETCPICELYFKLWKIKTPDAIELAKQIKPRTRVYFNAYSRDTGDVKVLSVGIKLFDKIVAAIVDSDYGNVADLERGHDLKIIRKSEKGGDGRTYPNYDQSAFRPGKTALAEKKSDIKEIMLKTHDLFELISVKSYEELKAVVDNLMGASGSSESQKAPESSEESQEAAPTKELTDDEFVRQLGG